jgi:hypothetical protein
MTSTEIRRIAQEAIDSTFSHVKAQWIKDVQATLLKTDFQAATMSAQLLKVNHSLFKWDEKGFTFAGKKVGPSLPLYGAIHGRQDAREKAEKETKKKLEEKQTAEARAAEKRRVQEFKSPIGAADGSLGKSKTSTDKFKLSLDELKSSSGHATTALRDVKRQSDAVEKSVGKAGKSAGVGMGFRQGETLGLRWPYVDFGNELFRPEWQLQRLT